jgi:hypothetical protein
MENTTFYIVCSVIILLGSVISSIITIHNAVKNPAKKYKEKQDAELKKVITSTIINVMPELFLKHDLETREKYKADRENYLQEISDEVLEKMMERFEERFRSLDNIPTLLEKLDTVAISTKDILREKIIKIYSDNKDKKTMTMLDREKLEQFYKDYKDLKGNSYIDKYYKRMAKWKTVDDEENDENDIV